MVSQVVESSSALLLQVRSEELKAAWQYYLALATYKPSVSSKIHYDLCVNIRNSSILYHVVHLLNARVEYSLVTFLNLLVVDNDEMVVK